MYRHSAQIPTAHKNALPSPEHTSDSDSEIIDLLDQKRQQLDDEIRAFKSAKDAEFRAFEKELRSKRKKDYRKHASTSDGPSKSSALSLLAGSNKHAQLNGSPLKSKRGCGALETSHRSKPAPLSAPTLSLDRLNIQAETTPPLTMIGTPPIPASMTKPLSRSPSNPSSMALTPPRTRPSNKDELALLPTPTYETYDSFAGVFTPAYLPLLESREGSRVSSPLPLSPRGELAPLQRQASVSLPHESVSPTLFDHSKRSLTAPILPSTSLPSALRTASGTTVRKRKRVTFRLQDSAIVEPSSSYEELPSPELDASESMSPKTDTGPDEDGINGRVLSNGHGAPDGSAKANGPNVGISDEDNPISFTVKNALEPLRSPLPRGTEFGFQAREQSSSSGLEVLGNLSVAADGGSGVGFFELDEELASPGAGEVKPFQFDDTDPDEIGQEAIASKRVAEHEDVDVNNGDGKDGSNGIGIGIGGGSRSWTVGGAGGGEKWTSASSRWGRSNGREGIDNGLAPTVGSVPINIVKPSGSWTASFGH